MKTEREIRELITELEAIMGNPEPSIKEALYISPTIGKMFLSRKKLSATIHTLRWILGELEV